MSGCDLQLECTILALEELDISQKTGMRLCHVSELPCTRPSFDKSDCVRFDETDGPSSWKSIAVYIENTEKYIWVYILKQICRLFFCQHISYLLSFSFHYWTTTRFRLKKKKFWPFVSWKSNTRLWLSVNCIISRCWRWLCSFPWRIKGPVGCDITLFVK